LEAIGISAEHDLWLHVEERMRPAPASERFKTTLLSALNCDSLIWTHTRCCAPPPCHAVLVREAGTLDRHSTGRQLSLSREGRTG
jgi:hypothetical protein